MSFELQWTVCHKDSPSAVNFVGVQIVLGEAEMITGPEKPPGVVGGSPVS